jgi:Zinc carboxypeptidase
MKSSALMVLLLSCLVGCRSSAPVADDLKSHAELTDFKETSRYDDVLKFFSTLQERSPLVHVEYFGKSQEGRNLPLVVLASPPVSTPEAARASGKPVVFIMANIHAGEVEGKEAMQQISRRLLFGDLRPLLNKLVILIAPIYNADGNEKISVQNRTDQYGPVGGVGVRENSSGLDLNRDYVKAEAPETLALIGLFNRWDPHLTVDLHTTDGSYHAYHLTYSIPLNPSIDANLFAYHRETMMPEIAKAMIDKHKFRTYYYGNFSSTGGGRGENPTNPTNPTAWYAFSQQPRAGQNYIGFRNRLTILSEAYSHLDFRGRVDVTEAFVEEIFKYSATHADEIRQLTKAADERTVARGLRGPPQALGVEYQPTPLPQPVDILVGEVTRVPNPASGVDMIAMVPDKMRAVKMQDFGLFTATRTVPAARAYLFPAEDGLRVPVEKLRAHGIHVEELTAPLTTEAESFTISNVKKSARKFQGHNEVKLTGEFKKDTTTFPAGTILVRTAQPLGLLAAYLLEPEADDGLVTWNYFDAYVDTGKVFPVQKIMGDFTAASRPLSKP